MGREKKEKRRRKWWCEAYKNTKSEISTDLDSTENLRQINFIATNVEVALQELSAWDGHTWVTAP